MPRRNLIPSHHTGRVWRAGLIALVIATTSIFAAVPGQATGSVGKLECTEHVLHVRIADPGPADYSLWGQLCSRRGTSPKTVQVLVPGGTYNHVYWDLPYRNGSYSYVRAATAAGYATFNFDRIGTGKSEHPPFDTLYLAGEATALHDVISALRSGAVGGHKFKQVIVAGHSYGGFVVVTEAARYRDVDGVISVGSLHGMTDVVRDGIGIVNHDANLDPKFAGLGYDGYLTTVPGVRGRLYHDPRTSNAAIVALDEQFKDLHSANLLPESFAYLFPPTPADAISRQLTAPVLALIGGADFGFCGAGGLDCTSAETVREQEAPYWPSRGTTFAVIPATGHSLHESTTEPITAAVMLAWSYTTARP